MGYFMIRLQAQDLYHFSCRVFHHLRRVTRLLLLDFVIVWIAYALMFLLRSFSASLNLEHSLPVILLSSLILVASLFMFGVYRRIWSRSSGYEVSLIILSVLFASSIMLFFNLVTGNRPLPLSIILLGNMGSLVGFVAVRYRTRLLSGLYWRFRVVFFHEFPVLGTRVLIVGAGETGQSLALRLKHGGSNRLYSIVGFIDDDDEKQGMYVEGCKVLGKRDDITALAERHNPEMIIVAIHNISGPDLRDILNRCEQTNALIKVVPEFFVPLSSHESFMRDIQPEDLLGRRPIERHEGIDLSVLTHKVVLVTGAAGSIGSELSRQICDYEPKKLIILDNNESALHDLLIDLQARHHQLNIIPALVDITIEEAVYDVFNQYQPQLVFHVAAYKHVPMLERYPMEAVRVNVQGTRHVIEYASHFKAERFVLISTDKAVNPSSVMGASKRICELMLHAYSHLHKHTLFSSVRFGNVLGSRGSVVPTFNRQIDQGGPVTVTSPEMTRYFMSIPEAVNLIIHAAAITQGNDIFILRMGEVVRIVELAERMIRLRGLRPYKDVPIEFTSVRPGEKMHEELFYKDESPLDTVHPGILKLDAKLTQIDEQRFWQDLSQLAVNIADCPQNALDIMRRLIQQSEVLSPR